MRRNRVAMMTVVALGLTQAPTAAAEPVTVLYDGQVVEIERTLADPNDLWIIPEDLPRVNGFELKPEGACLDELCVPVLQDRDSEMFVTRARQPWFNVTELARKLEQAYAADHGPPGMELRRDSGHPHELSAVGHGARFRAPEPGGRTGSSV